MQMKTNQLITVKNIKLRRKYMREYMKDRRADDNFRINENQKRVQGCNINSKTSRNKKHEASKRRN